MNKVKIKEIFTSIQGEGPYVGYKQLFVRFCECNLNCNYCDTEFVGGKEFTADELIFEINQYNDIHSVSLTGGEPLLSADFLKKVLPQLKKTVYLETNATLFDKFDIVKPWVDIVSADIKLESATGLNTFELHDKFFKKCEDVETFAKIVFNDKVTEKEIEKCCEIGKKYGIELILQPEMKGDEMTVSSTYCAQILDKFLDKYQKVRLIPQVHKFLDVR